MTAPASLPDAPAHPNSLWAATAEPPPPSPPFEGSASVDAIVIGGGYTGCSTALHLAERGTTVALLEALEFGSGAAGRSMGLVNPHFRTLPSDILRRFGPALGQRMNETFHAGPDTVFDVIRRHAIRCDAVRTGTMQLGETRRGLAFLRRFHEEFAASGAPNQWLDRRTAADLAGTTLYDGGYIDRRAGTIQPLSYVRGLARAAQAKGAALHTRSRAIAIKRQDGRWRVATARGAIAAEHVVVATDAYSDDLLPDLERALVPLWSNIVATAPLSANPRRLLLPGGQAFGDTRLVPRHFRTDRDGRLVVVTIGRTIEAAWSPLSRWGRHAIRQAYPHLGDQALPFRWDGILGMSRNHLPYLHQPAPGLHVPLGYSGRGITSATVVGKHLAERILGAPDDAFPLPKAPLGRAPLRGLHGFAYEAGLHLGRLWGMIG